MADWPEVSPYAAGLAGKCPRCGEGDLFAGYLSLRARCASCGLDFAQADSGDGPAVFVIFIAGFAAVALVFILRFGMGAPVWLALLASVAAAAALSLGLLRPFKATLIALQYRHKAEEGRLEE